MEYQANPVIVQAFKIVEIEGAESTGADLVEYHLVVSDGFIRKQVTADPPMCSRMTPAIGDYWVIQSDGYVYLNPKEVFERKYSVRVTKFEKLKADLRRLVGR